MPAGLTFADVRKIARTLDGTEEATAYGAFCLKVKKKMIACVAINKDAEPNSLMIRMPIDQRDALIAEEPDVYYLKPHYEPYPCVLVRLGKVHRDALRDLLTGAWRQAAAAKPPRRSPRARAKRSGARAD
ncbi:MAG TPA: MmcQ/YjbR family DNA-binding protein [Vicinamibacterales bacterium]|nr:MmcQ/YjbR family DNA-binding protein [Vicinamibacterales bacterium]